MRWLLLPLLVGCSDYGFSKPGGGAGADPGDTADDWPGGGADDSTPGDDSDTATPPESGDPPDTSGTPDTCYEPEDGYALNPAARLVTLDSTSRITFTFLSSSTDYDDELWMDGPETTLIARGWTDPPGTTWSVGPYAAGTEIVLGLQVMDTGDHWQSGPGSRNADGVVHGAATYEGGCAWVFGFEDLNGGGDLDYNDIIMRVEGMLMQQD